MAKKESSVSVSFGSKTAAEHFKVWLCEQGEQDYWIWMAEREHEEAGDITAVSFKYGPGLSIKTEMGRLDTRDE